MSYSLFEEKSASPETITNAGRTDDRRSQSAAAHRHHSASTTSAGTEFIRAFDACSRVSNRQRLTVHPHTQFQRPPAGIRFVTTASPLTFPPGAIVQTQQQLQRPQITPQMQAVAAAAAAASSVQQQQQQPQAPPPPPAPVTPAPKAKSKAKPRASSTPKEKDKKISTSLREDDDINDVAAMGGVNLAEENQRMAAAANEVGTQIRSCKDETFFLTNTLASKISRISKSSHFSCL